MARAIFWRSSGLPLLKQPPKFGKVECEFPREAMMKNPPA
jgi:hypothetical protein